MHVAFICNEYPPGVHGGVGSLTQTIARRLVVAGHRATVVGTYRSGQGAPRARVDDDEGVQVIRLASHGRVPGVRAITDQRRLWQELTRVHRADPVDLVEGPEPSFWAAPRNLAFPAMVRMNGGHRFFAEAEGHTPAAVRSWVERRSIRRADDLVAVSEYTAGRTRALLDLGDRRITVIPNPIDVSEFRPDGAPTAGTVLFFGTVCEKKGVRQLVEAFPAVAAAVPRARLVIAGRDQADPATGTSFTARLRESIPRELADRVEFLGPVEHDVIRGLIADAEVCALPSHMEAFPVAWIEALAAGRALVASNTGPGPEVVDDGVSGLLVDPHDPTAIARALIEVLTDADRRDRLGAGGRARAVERFSIEHLVETNLAHYAAVAGRGGEA